MNAERLHDDSEQQGRIDAICVRFAQSWRQGERPAIEDYLGGAKPEDRPQLLQQLFHLEWTERRLRDEAFDGAEYRQRFAANAAVVALAWQNWVPPTLVHTARPTHRPPLACGVVGGLPPGYHDVVPIGKGGMGTVYRGFDPKLGRFVALKVLHCPEPDLLARFQVEGMALARMRHPHIVQVYSHEECQGQPCLVMEYVPGGTLEDRLAGQEIPFLEAARLVAILARAVQSAHSAGVVHRDLKPANVLMGEPVEGSSGNVLGGWPKVSDFGLARLAEGHQCQTESGIVMGTAQYMAPEQALGRVREIGPASDVWALGVILYRCLTGRLPFTGDSVVETLDKVRREEPLLIGKLRVGVPAELENLCMRCMAKEAGKRPTMGELAVDLEAVVARVGAADAAGARDREAASDRPPIRLHEEDTRSGAGTGKAEDAETAELPAKPRRWRWYLGAGAVAVMAVVGIVLLFRGTTTPPSHSLRVKQFRVLHWDVEGETAEFRGVLGEKSRGAKFGDQVRVHAIFSRPVHAYLIAYNPNGKEQLLWPCNDRGIGREGVRPEAVDEILYPPKRTAAFNLDDEPAGGMQAMAVVISGDPLSSFEEWKRRRGQVPWSRLAENGSVWECDAEGSREWQEGLSSVVRGSPGRKKGMPPLELLREALNAAGAEVVELIAFGVQGKEGK